MPEHKINLCIEELLKELTDLPSTRPEVDADFPFVLSCADLQPGHVPLPNGHGLDDRAADGTLVHKGVSPNELTDGARRDPFAGTPWHKHVPVRINGIEASTQM